MRWLLFQSSFSELSPLANYCGCSVKPRQVTTSDAPHVLRGDGEWACCARVGLSRPKAHACQVESLQRKESLRSLSSKPFLTSIRSFVSCWVRAKELLIYRVYITQLVISAKRHLPSNDPFECHILSVIFKNVSNIFFFYVYLFWEREHARAHSCCLHVRGRGKGQRERERGRERESQAGSAVTVQGSNSRTVRSWPEPKSRVGCFTDWATQVPPSILLFDRNNFFISQACELR